MEKTRLTSVRNAYGIKVKRCCASCQHKCIQKDGSRFCAVMMVAVDQKSKCKDWQMSDGMRFAGTGGGEVREKETKEIIL
jgi:hypothetical protein